MPVFVSHATPAASETIGFDPRLVCLTMIGPTVRGIHGHEGLRLGRETLIDVDVGLHIRVAWGGYIGVHLVQQL